MVYLYSSWRVGLAWTIAEKCILGNGLGNWVSFFFALMAASVWFYTHTNNDTTPISHIYGLLHRDSVNDLQYYESPETLVLV